MHELNTKCVVRENRFFSFSQCSERIQMEIKRKLTSEQESRCVVYSFYFSCSTLSISGYKNVLKSRTSYLVIIAKLLLPTTLTFIFHQLKSSNKKNDGNPCKRRKSHARTLKTQRELYVETVYVYILYAQTHTNRNKLAKSLRCNQ